MNGLHHRLPCSPSRPDSTTSTMSPTRPESCVDEVPCVPYLPSYDDLHPKVSISRLPSYEEAIKDDHTNMNFHPPLPNPKFIPPLSDAEKMSIAIDRVLGPIGSPLEQAELAWWRRGDTVNSSSLPSADTNKSSPISTHTKEVYYQQNASKPWLGNGAPDHVVSVNRPSAPVFPLPSPPTLPSGDTRLKSGLCDSSKKDISLSYLSSYQPIKYNRAYDGASLQSVRREQVCVCCS